MKSAGLVAVPVEVILTVVATAKSAIISKLASIQPSAASDTIGFNEALLFGQTKPSKSKNTPESN